MVKARLEGEGEIVVDVVPLTLLLNLSTVFSTALEMRLTRLWAEGGVSCWGTRGVGAIIVVAGAQARGTAAVIIISYSDCLSHYVFESDGYIT